MKETLNQELVFPQGVTATLEGARITIKGPKGEVSRKFVHPKVDLALEGTTLKLSAKKATKREKTLVRSFEAHLKNMVQGVQEPFKYVVRICSGHFPMNVSIKDNELTVKNFLGESVPRKVQLDKAASIKIDGTEIEITSPDKEIAGQSAAKIEDLCRITNKDRRIFQDGCYIVHKAGKDI